ncbi:MAG: hypothetical protein HRT36_08470 [Alphaproteobacteria bacterium]|nr:hypothetical protein [Alphaproteobacteria bacterium]
MSRTADAISLRLVEQYNFTHNGEWLNGGTCPRCSRNEAYARAEKPYVIFCSRSNKCGETTRARELFPDLFENYNKRYKPSRSNLTATADAYLSIERGFDPATIKG